MTAAGQDRSGLQHHWDLLPHGSLSSLGEVPSTRISRALLDLQPPSAPITFLIVKCPFASASVPSPKLTGLLFLNLYLPLMRSCQLCSFQWLGVADWVYANLSSGSPRGKAASCWCHTAVCDGDEQFCHSRVAWMGPQATPPALQVLGAGMLHMTSKLSSVLMPTQGHRCRWCLVPHA